MKIAVMDDYQDAFKKTQAAAKLHGHEIISYNTSEKDPAKFAQRAAGCEVIVLTQQRSFLPTPFIAALPTSVKLLAQTGRNVPHIDTATCTSRGIIVSASGGGNSSPTVELTWALILASVRNLGTEINNMQAGRWQTTAGIGLRGKTLGIYAYGKIGSGVAQVGKAFGMKVLVWGREASCERARADGYRVARGREAFFEECDVISLHMRLVETTRGIIKVADLARMKPLSLIVNTSRAGLIEPDALVNALRAGRPGMAAVDVYEEEPLLDTTHPLLNMPNVVCTPHIGYVGRDEFELQFNDIFDQIKAYAAGKPINVVNPGVLDQAKT